MKTYALTLWLLFVAGCIDQSVQRDPPEVPRPDVGLDTLPEDLGTDDAARLDAVLPDANRPDAELPDTETPDAAIQDAAPDAAPRVLIDSPCPDDPDRGMVGAHMPDGRCYLIDALQVTMGQYWAAEEANGPLRSAEPLCEGVESAGFRTGGQFGTYFEYCADDLWGVVEGPDGERGDPYVSWPPDPWQTDYAMRCINWCDAVAYCANAGKRLCTNQVIADWRLSDAGEAREYETNEVHDEWYNALTAGGAVGLPTSIGDFRGGFEGLNHMSTDYMGPFPMTSFGIFHFSHHISFYDAVVFYGEAPGRWNGAQTLPSYLLMNGRSDHSGIRCCDDAAAP